MGQMLETMPLGHVEYFHPLICSGGLCITILTIIHIGLHSLPKFNLPLIGTFT